MDLIYLSFSVLTCLSGQFCSNFHYIQKQTSSQGLTLTMLEMCRRKHWLCVPLPQPLCDAGAIFIFIFITCVLNDCMNVI